MAVRSIDLLESMLGGEDITADELDDLVNDQVSEDLHLEYKHGDELQKGKRAGATIREYVSAFANSAGGVLVVGVDNATWEVTGCCAPGGGDLREWASRCLTPIAPYLSPQARPDVVQHPKGDVLLVAADRSMNLVPLVEDQKPVYYLRIHDQTIKAPEYLVSDLLLGRRNRPFLDITAFSLEAITSRPASQFSVDHEVAFIPTFTIENGSLAQAVDVSVGITCWSRKESARQSSLMSRHLRSFLDVRELSAERIPEFYGLYHDTRNRLAIKELGAFDYQTLHATRVNLPERAYGHRYSLTWYAAVYLMSRETPPTWYQARLTVDQNLFNHLATDPDNLTPESPFLEFTRLSSERPVVALSNLQRM